MKHGKLGEGDRRNKKVEEKELIVAPQRQRHIKTHELLKDYKITNKLIEENIEIPK